MLRHESIVLEQLEAVEESDDVGDVGPGFWFTSPAIIKSIDNQHISSK